MNRLRICLSGNTAWGMLNFRRGLIEHFVGQGHEVHLIVPNDDATAGLRKLRCQVHDILIDSKGNRPLVDLATIRAFQRLYRAIEPDIVINYTIKPVIYGGFAASSLRIPFLSVITGLGSSFSGPTLLTHIVMALYRWSQRRTSGVFLLNVEDGEIVANSRLVPESAIRLIPGEGIDLDHFRPGFDENAGPIAWGDDGCTSARFLFAGRLLREKGVEDFVEAARRVRAQVPSARFALLGPCDVENPSAIGRGQVAQWEREGVIEYFGSVSDIRPYVESASCVVLPSYYREGVPRILLEASAMGKPVITTDMPGCRDAVTDAVSGFLVPARQVAALEQACLRVASMPASEQRVMGKAGREKMVRRFDQRIVIAAYAEAIERALVPKTLLARQALWP